MTIETEEQYNDALKRVEKLWDHNCAEHERCVSCLEFDQVVDDIIAYEEVAFPEFNDL